MFLVLGWVGAWLLLQHEPDQVRALAYVRAQTAQRIQTGSGSVWAQADDRLYFTALRREDCHESEHPMHSQASIRSPLTDRKAEERAD